MVRAGKELAARGITVATFDFPYITAGRGVPDKPPVLEAHWRKVLDEVRGRADFARLPLFIGGKSMGGRMATQLAAAEPELPVAGLVLLGYPLHPPGQPQKRRDAHLASIHKPMLVIQGSRDTFGTPDELRPILDALAPPASLHVVEGGDHSFKVSRSADRQAAIDAAVRRTAADWMRAVMQSSSANPTPPR